jgi:hypothetical protein
MNQKLEMGPKSETWTRKFNQVEQLHMAMPLFALSGPVMAAFAKHTGDGQLPSIQNDSGLPQGPAGASRAS